MNFILELCNHYQQEDDKMRKEFQRRYDEACCKYWEACKYPRKTKKRMRKEALIDANLYNVLMQDIQYTF